MSHPVRDSKVKESEGPMSSYTVLRTIRDTLCGKVKLAKENNSDRLVAMKFSSRHALKELQQRSCAEDPAAEIRLMKKLNQAKACAGGEYVIRLLDNFSVKRGGQDFDCTVLEFADGGELFDHVQQLAAQSNRLDLESVRSVFRMVAMGVQFIHTNDITHGDLSLENLLITKNGIVKICDFGLAREGRKFETSSHPRGKIPYMAPEVFNLKAYDGFKADVWSLGVILWSLITSFGLYEIPTDADARFARLRFGKKGIKEMLHAFKVPNVPDVVVDLLSGLLHLDPEARLDISEVLLHPWVVGKRTSLLPEVELKSDIKEIKPDSKSTSSPTPKKRIVKATIKAVKAAKTVKTGQTEIHQKPQTTDSERTEKRRKKNG